MDNMIINRESCYHELFEVSDDEVVAVPLQNHWVLDAVLHDNLSRVSVLLVVGGLILVHLDVKCLLL